MKADHELLELASRRYQGEPALALMQFASDRRRAGLGALDIAKRNPGKRKPIRHTKEVWQDGRVYYKSVLDIPARLVYLPPQPAISLAAFKAQLTVKTERRPAVKQVRVLPIEFRKFECQSGRREVAMLLRELRKGIRAADQTKEGPA